MQALSKKLSQLLSLIAKEDLRRNKEDELVAPLLAIEQGMKVRMDDINALLKHIAPKIEYLFWLSHETDDEQVYDRLVDFISLYQDLESQYC